MEMLKKVQVQINPLKLVSAFFLKFIIHVI